jgi:hypothetical protein
MDNKSAQQIKVRLYNMENSIKDLTNKVYYLNNKFEEVNTKLNEVNVDNSSSSNDDKTLDLAFDKKIQINN